VRTVDRLATIRLRVLIGRALDERGQGGEGGGAPPLGGEPSLPRSDITNADNQPEIGTATRGPVTGSCPNGPTKRQVAFQEAAPGERVASQ
jgi:hypothetical protein